MPTPQTACGLQAPEEGSGLLSLSPFVSWHVHFTSHDRQELRKLTISTKASQGFGGLAVQSGAKTLLGSLCPNPEGGREEGENLSPRSPGHHSNEGKMNTRSFEVRGEVT